MLQLIDIPDKITAHEKTCGLNRAFFAPEVMQVDSSSRALITAKVDVWSLGAMLYLLIDGAIMKRNAEENSSMHVNFDFGEQVWGEV